MNKKIWSAISLAVVLAMLLTSLALADQISADADALAVAAPHANSLTATQNGGTTVAYDLSAYIKETGNSSDDVFPGSIQVSISRSGDWLAGSSGTPSSFTFTGYDAGQAGTIRIAVPCGSQGVLKTMTAVLSAGASSNGKTLNPATVTLTYQITAGPDDPSCAPPPPSDTTPPDISYVLSPASPDGLNGWYVSDVTLTWTVTENESPSSLVKTGCVDQNITADQAATDYSCSATSDGGSAGPVTVTIKRDATAPSISGSASPAPNGAGWNNSDVTVSFTCGDNLSGVASCGPNQTLSSDGGGQSASGTAFDNAGNSASTTVSGINIDKTAPSFGSCPAGGPFLLNSGMQAVGPISVDASISGLNTLLSTLSGSVDTSSVGSKTVNFTAVDNADNSASTSCSYSVIYNWSGFFQPVDNLPVVNKAKAGSAIPVKFSLSGDQGLSIFVSGYPASQPVACSSGLPTDIIETTLTAGGSSLSYDATADQYVYVWKTDKAWAGTCRTLTVKLVDGTMHQANFQFVK